MFCGVEFFEGIKPVRAIIVAAFVDDNIETNFPAVKRAVAVRAVIFGFGSSFITIVGLKIRRANLTA